MPPALAGGFLTWTIFLKASLGLLDESFKPGHHTNRSPHGNMTFVLFFVWEVARESRDSVCLGLL